MKGRRKIALHICMICCFVCAITQILDWYNPYMDFGGHISFVWIVLYLSVLYLKLVSPGNRKRKEKIKIK